jgi:hypothetical protein
MTQVIAAVTQDYALLVADRRLTFLGGQMQGQVMDDDACKLVSLCNVTGIGYTGLAQLDGIPTHEWIAKTLASETCSDPGGASRILTEHARVALSKVSKNFRRHTFILVGWAYFTGLTGIRPHICAVTNMMDAYGQVLSTANDSFAVLVKVLHDGEDVAIRVSGQPLLLERGQRLERNLRKLITREISPKAALRLLVDEVIHTAELSSTVGKKVLGFCIPRRAAQKAIESGKSVLLAAQPNEEAASFCYYDPSYSELQQFGPTLTCGGFASTDIKTENDTVNERQSSQLRILALPKRSIPNAAQQEPVFKQREATRPIIGFELGIPVENAVRPGALYAIPAAIRNTGDTPIVFAKNLTDDVGQEVPPSVQGGAVPAITFCWPAGAWTIRGFEPVSRIRFAGVVIKPGDLFEFEFGIIQVPNAPVGSISRTAVVNFSIRFTDTVTGGLMNICGQGFRFPTNVNKPMVFRISKKSVSSNLSFSPARVIDTATGELISGPVEGPLPQGGRLGPITDTAICGGKPGVSTGSSSPASNTADGKMG